MFRICIIFLITFSISNAYADDMQAIVNQILAQQDALKNNSYSHLKNFDPNSNFDHYSSNPNQTQYYGGITQSDTAKLNQDAQNAKTTNDAGSAVNTSIHNRPSFVITQNDPDISHSQFIQNNAESIVKGITDRYVNCQTTQICKTTFQQKICEEAPQSITQACTKTLNIDVIPHETSTHYTLVAHVKTSDHTYAGVVINAVTGAIGFIGPHDASFRLDGRLPSSLDCHGLQGSITQFNDHGRGTHLDSIDFPTCSNGMALNFHLSSSKTINLDMQIDVLSKVITYEIKDRWVENCDGLLQEPSCQFKSKICSQPKATKTFQGIPVTRDCWQETYNYLCHGGSGDGNCKALQTQGCEQINSVCKNKSNNECVLYQQTYQCPIQTCSASSNVVCGDGSNYCLDGNCVDHSYQQSKDFAKGVSALSALSDASKQFDPSSMKMFSGHPSECSEIPVGFSNCCTETGWGQDMGLANCPLEAKKLHESREKGVAIKVGRYCSGPDPFPCLEHSQVFCVFNSKLAKIIEEQGRAGQLQIDFGSAKSPNCQGITPDQLKLINLDKIDFQEFYADIHAKTPDMNLIQQKISQQVQQFQQAGQISG
ncbi:MAG: type-F conjugative transfer system mating-pair stabilization protein TraN [Gammaproteobacteria bacterium]